jgi:hypothetical protein
VDPRLARERGTVSEQALARALAATGISPQRLGPTRAARLSGPERRLYRRILRSFAEGRPLDLAEEPASAVATLAREDLVHVDDRGSIVVAYPFSGRPTRHRVRFDGRELYAMCAIDALGIAPMLGLPIEILSRDPVEEQTIEVSLEPDGSSSWSPGEAVVLSGCIDSGVAFQSCCRVLNFFASRDNAHRYLELNPATQGYPISMPVAIELGRRIFGQALD